MAAVAAVAAEARPTHRKFLSPLMTSPDSASSLADRLVTACDNNDVPSAQAAVGDGACVNEAGMNEDGWTWFPLAVAVYEKHVDVVVWLLSQGADPNGDNVMYYGACHSAPGILQLLIDAGGDVNQSSGGVPPLFTFTAGVALPRLRRRICRKVTG